MGDAKCDEPNSSLNSLTATDVLQASICGVPKSVKMRVVGLTAPQLTPSSTVMHCYLSNDNGFFMRLQAWAPAADELSQKLRLNTIVEFKNLEVKPYYLGKGEKNITSSGKEFNYNPCNSKMLPAKNLPLAVSPENKINEYPSENRFPPFWKYLSDINQYDKCLAGRLIALSDFEEYTLSVFEFGKEKLKYGIYGTAGDANMQKAFFFVECDPNEVGEALHDFRKGSEFRYQDGKGLFKGEILWLQCNFIWTSSVEDGGNVNINIDDYSFVKKDVFIASKSVVKSEPESSDVTPVKKSRRSLF